MSAQNLRRFFIAGIAVGGVEGVKSTKCDQVCRASELPIYMDDNEARKRQAELCPAKPGLIENAFGSVRRQVWSMFDGFKVYQSQAEDFMNDSTAKANSWLTFFSEEADETTRMGAIGVGAITGYILGMRGGFFKRIFYSGLVSGGMTAVCYPKQTAEYSREAISSARKGATIGYNFIFGVTDQFEKFERPPSSEVSTVTPEQAMQEIQDSHSLASKSCHCPVGACHGRHEHEK